MNGNTTNTPSVPPSSASARPPNPQGPPNQSRLPPPMPRSDANRMVGVAQYFPPNKPFEAVQFTNDQFTDIKTSLDKTLGPEYVSSRPGGGGTSVAYLEGWRALNIANEIFGFNGWSSAIVGYTLDFCDTSRDGRISMGLSVVVRVTIKDGTYHEDIGYGYIDNAKSKAAAYEKCKKEALTDGVKRCLRCFGNVLGNCLYDKALMSKLRGIPKNTTDLGENDLYRDDTFTKIRDQRQHTTKVNIMPGKEKAEYKQKVDHKQTTDKEESSAGHKQPPPTDPKEATPATKQAPGQDEFDDSFLFSDDAEMNKIDDYEMEMIMNKSDKENEEPDIDNTFHKTNAPKDAVAPPIPFEVPLFVSAKRADLLNTTPSTDIPQFDPKFVSPNIRRTLDPTRSAPVRRNDISTSQTPSKPLVPLMSTTTTPSTKRMIGMPPSRTPVKRLHKD